MSEKFQAILALGLGAALGILIAPWLAGLFLSYANWVIGS